ncbi:sigma 54-interacting transcriptional regulator [Sedimentibacter hydroxybenzoicus DSM 7310]|uniref:Sigma 54-interacting transcriptional regulator n=1 Tax=Sedimentibacter hydroxybenzoicus DSM 7310 TaxID=1123245 RepID=A0A974BJF4_SEDHY|nr:sigma 54-interacting transcriptional regulator [Sedimentibacter hydroxybenzoicus]NYB73996.1 sigma 54-interacting transcriptional regulator [Sedimentibacter hydroxybenzoicus DSM 7310]
MPHIYYAAYNEDLIPLTIQIFKDLGKDVGAMVYDHQNPQKLLETGAKVFLSRGDTANRIRSKLDVPVVEIPIPFDDMIKCLLEASKMGKNIGVVGYNNLLSGLELLNPLLNINIKQVFANNPEEMLNKILQLKNEGIDVIVGGIYQTNVAKKLNIKNVRIDFSHKALEYAYNEAEFILETILLNNRKNEELKAILDTTKEGYIAIDKKGIITLINQTSLKLISNDVSPLIGTPLIDVFPELKHLMDIVNTGEESLQDIVRINETDVLCNMIPLKHNKNEVIGAIATFNDIYTITKGERKIRNKILNKGFYATYKFTDIKYTSRSIKECISNAKKFAVSDSTVLILGETGVGKELFAQSIHNESYRKHGPFVAINCASLPENILESELFGYEEGAFTGAKKNGKEGLFELAHNGTIFLDEISEMPLSLQARFLRVLQERKVMRLGSDQIIPINVRVISATNKDIKNLVYSKKFRDDLFYRLNVLTLNIPPLRDRKDDINVLINNFCKTYIKNRNISIQNDAIDILKDYKWPGNIRQLKNFIEKLSIISNSNIINAQIVKNMISSEPEFETTDYTNKIIKIPITKEEVYEALSISNGNKMEAANMLGVHRSTLWRLMKKYDLC